MEEYAVKAIKQDFLTWSGGFPPESDEQIFVYVETARSSETDDEEVRNLLKTWMENTQY